MVERISGPFNGFYIATRAQAAGDANRFVAHSKICRGKPDNFRDAHWCDAVELEQPFGSATEAITTAEQRAREQTGRLAAFAFAPAAAREAHAR